MNERRQNRSFENTQPVSKARKDIKLAQEVQKLMPEVSGEELPQNTQPLVSVIVPVYNVAKYLPMCFDSLLFQTMKEIEIIVVNDGSPDNSQEIINQYVQMFPGRIISLQKENGGLSSARKYGFEHARAPYIMFVDSDDYIEYHTCELLYAKAIETNADAVYAPAYIFDEVNHEYKNFGKLNKNEYDEVLVKGKASLCSLLLRVDYVKQYEIFENMVYEDAATTMGMLSHTEKVSFVNVPCYAYIVNRAGSLTFHNKRASAADTVKADQLVWARANVAKRPQLAARILNRIVSSANNIYQVYDLIVQHAKDFAYKLMPYEDTIIKYLGKGRIQAYNKLLLEPDVMTPMRVYLNGFDQTTDKEIYLDRVSMPYIGDYEIIWLDATSCDLDAAPQRIKELHASGHMDMVAVWFALQKIQQTGGVYIGTDIRVVNTFNRLRFFKAFMGFATDRVFNDRVFGGQANQPVWDVFASMLDRPNVTSVQQALGLTLCGWGGIHLNGKQQVIRDSVTVLESSVLTTHCDRYSKSNVCVYLPKFDTPEEYYAFFKQGLEACYTHLVEPSTEVAAASAKNTPDMALNKEHDMACKELDAIKNTLSWKITKPLRAVRTLLNKVKK